MKKNQIYASLFACALLAACGNDAPSTETNNTAPQASAVASAPSTDVEVKHNPNWQTYLVGSEISYQPFEYKNENGEPIGFEVELLNEVAHAAEMNVKFIHMPRKTLEEQLNKDVVQIGASALSINPERAAIMNLSEPFLDYQPAILVLDKPENAALKDKLDLTGKTITMNANSSESSIKKAIEMTGSEDKVLKDDSFYLSVRNVFTGKADAAMGDSRVLAHYAMKFPETKALIIPMGTDKKQLGFAVKKGNTELLNKINSGLATIKQNGVYDKLVQKYFGE